jgi:hypothetical protein
MITGRVGHIRWAYYTAAQIEGYTVARTRDGKWSLTAIVVLADSFKMAQRPLTFTAKHAKGEWRWPITSMTLNQDTKRLTAELGAPEKN